MSIVTALLSVAASAQEPGEVAAMHELPARLDPSQTGPDRREEAILGVYRSAPEATPILTAVLRTDPGHDVRLIAAGVLADRLRAGIDPAGAASALSWGATTSTDAEVRARCVEALGELGDANVGDAVAGGLEDPASEVRQAARQGCRTWVRRHPQDWSDAAEACRSLPATRVALSMPQLDGDAAATAALYGLTMGYGGYVGGNVGYLVDEAAEGTVEKPVDQEAIAVGSVLGVGAGLGTAALLSSRTDMSPAGVAGLGTGLLVGGFVGHNIGAAFIRPGDVGRPERIQAAQLAGTVGGGGIALLRGRNVRSVGSNLHQDLATIIGWQTAAGLSDIAGLEGRDDAQLRSGLALAGGLGFLGTAAAVGPHLELPTGPTVLLAAGDGAWLGAWAPYLFADEPTDAQVSGGLRLGLGAGYLGTLALAGTGAQPSPRSVGMQAIGLSAGSALGAGIPLALGADGPARAVVAPMLAAGAGGQLVGALAAPRYAVSEDDRFLLATLGLWTGYQTAGWSLYAAAADDGSSRPLGYGLTAGGAGTLLTMASAPLLDVEPATSAQLLASGAWGTAFAGLGSELADLDADERWLATLAGGDAAIALTAVAAAAGLHPTWSDVGIVNGAGAMGAAAGGLLGVVFLYDDVDRDPMMLATLGGSAAGLATGTVLAALTRGGAHDLALPELAQLGAQPSLAVRPWTDENDQPGVWVELRLDEI